MLRLFNSELLVSLGKELDATGQTCSSPVVAVESVVSSGVDVAADDEQAHASNAHNTSDPRRARPAKPGGTGTRGQE